MDAKHVFGWIPEWTSMISGYAQIGQDEPALKLYAQMQQEGVVSNDKDLLVHCGCACLAGLDKGKEISA